MISFVIVVSILKVFKVYDEYCRSVVVVFKYIGSVVDVDGVLLSMWKCYSSL